MSEINYLSLFGQVRLNKAIDQMGRALDTGKWPEHGWVTERKLHALNEANSLLWMHSMLTGAKTLRYWNKLATIPKIEKTPPLILRGYILDGLSRDELADDQKKILSLIQSTNFSFEPQQAWPDKDFEFIKAVVETAREWLHAGRVEAVYLSADGDKLPVPASAWGRRGVRRSIAYDEPLKLLDENGDVFRVDPQIRDGALADLWPKNKSKSGRPRKFKHDPQILDIAKSIKEDSRRVGEEISDTGCARTAIRQCVRENSLGDSEEDYDDYSEATNAEGDVPFLLAVERMRRKV